MFCLGTLINTAAIVIGGLAGTFFGKVLTPVRRDALNMACGVSVLFIGVAGAMEGMLSAENGVIASGGSMLLTLCLALGALVGELINIEDRVERLGEWLKRKTGNGSDAGFVNAFVTASLTVCIGAMAVVGAIKDGLEGDYSILATKAVLDLVIIFVMTCSMGKGCAFSAIPVFVLEGGMTLLASLLKNVMTPLAMGYLSMIGSVLIFCVGVNLVWGKKVRVANLLPALIFAAAAACIPL